MSIVSLRDVQGLNCVLGFVGSSLASPKGNGALYFVSRASRKTSPAAFGSTDEISLNS